MSLIESLFNIVFIFLIISSSFGILRKISELYDQSTISKLLLFQQIIFLIFSALTAIAYIQLI